jgi:Ras-related protein Rab-11A
MSTETKLSGPTTRNAAVLKLCILGEGGVGKSTLTQRLITGQFNPATKMTIGIDFQLLKTSIFDPQAPETADNVAQIPIQAQIWDFGGEERFRFMLPRYCKGAVGGLLLYDLSRYSTTRYIEEWFGIWKNNSPPNSPLILIGSKADLLSENELPKAEESLAQMAKELNITHYYTVSSLSGRNVHIMANDLLKEAFLFNLSMPGKKI